MGGACPVARLRLRGGQARSRALGTASYCPVDAQGEKPASCHGHDVLGGVWPCHTCGQGVIDPFGKEEHELNSCKKLSPASFSLGLLTELPSCLFLKRSQKQVGEILRFYKTGAVYMVFLFFSLSY